MFMRLFTLFASDLPSATEGEIPMIVENVEGVFFRMIISFFAFVLFAGASLYFLRRFLRNRGQKGPVRHIHILEKKAISPKSMLYLVDLEGKKILIGESQVELRVIGKVEKEKKEDLEELLQEKQAAQIP